VIRNGNRQEKKAPTLVDAATKTGNRRNVMLDPRPLTPSRDCASNASRSVRGCSRSASGPRIQTASLRGGSEPERFPASTRRGACTTSGIGRPPWRLPTVGHANAAMTLHYAHPSEAVDKAVASILAEALAASDPDDEQ
jgi:hypothetical protein